MKFLFIGYDPFNLILVSSPKSAYHNCPRNQGM